MPWPEFTLVTASIIGAVAATVIPDAVAKVSAALTAEIGELTV